MQQLSHVASQVKRIQVSTVYDDLAK
jgi:hypothetical protein